MNGKNLFPKAGLIINRRRNNAALLNISFNNHQNLTFYAKLL